MPVNFSASNCNFKVILDNVTVNPACKYLGVFIDSKLLFISHNGFVKMRLEKQCGIALKFKNYVLRRQLLDYYRKKIPLPKIGDLVYGLWRFHRFKPSFYLTKENKINFSF